MKTKIKHIISVGLFILVFTSCGDDYEIFKEELYEQKAYLISDDENIFPLVYSLEDDAPRATMSIAVSGTNHIDRDASITLERDTILLKKYNLSQFDIEEEKYAKELRPADFTMPSMSVQLKASSADYYETLDVNIDAKVLDKLSPDSSYFIAMNIKSTSGLEINELKRSALYRIYKKNKYSSLKDVAQNQYTMKGYTRKESVSSSYSISGAKYVHPLTKNSVRMFISNTPFEAKLEKIAQYGMIIRVNTDNTLAVEPYNEDAGLLEAELLDASGQEIFINKFVEEKDGDEEIYTFYLYYKYRTRESNSGTWSEWNINQEQIRYKKSNY